MVGTLHDSVLTLDSPNWAESDPASAMQFPGCYLSAGLLADFFGRVAGAQLAVMEVECRSMGSERCRFLLGSAETMQHIYDAMAQGVNYDVHVITLQGELESEPSLQVDASVLAPLDRFRPSLKGRV